MEKRHGFIYVTINKINGKKYVGKCVYCRKNNWKSYLGSGVYLLRAIRKYGKDNFERIIIDECNSEEELREVEEYYITMFNAVNSNDFYNIKMTAIGGDTFTHNPNKEITRRKKSWNSRGKRNPMYGKLKSKAMIDSVKKANSKPCSINGTIYSSLTNASLALGINNTTISYRINAKSEKFKDYFYIENENVS